MHFEFWGNLSKFQAKAKKKKKKKTQGGDLVTETGNWGIYATFRSLPIIGENWNVCWGLSLHNGDGLC